MRSVPLSDIDFKSDVGTALEYRAWWSHLPGHSISHGIRRHRIQVLHARWLYSRRDSVVLGAAIADSGFEGLSGGALDAGGELIRTCSTTEWSHLVKWWGVLDRRMDV